VVRPRLILSAILLVELWIFSGSFHKYFNHDSVFYLVNYPHSWNDAQQLFLEPDDSRQYRPLTLALMGIVVPFLQLNSRSYHWIPLLFHLLNTALFYALARRLLSSSTAVLVATAFWGLHSVAGWITYDITYLSDFLLAFLLLASLILAIDGTARRSHFRLAASFLLFILALLTKESATTFPAALWICLILAGMQNSEEPATARRMWPSLKKTMPLTALFLLAAIAHASLLVHWVRTDHLYAQGPTQAYDIDPWTNLLGKTKYLYWALNLPDALRTTRAARDRALAFSLLAIPLAVALLDILRRKGKLSPSEWGGLIWFIALNVPALMLSIRLAKWYLYTPLFGLALTVGALAESTRAAIASRSARIAAPLVLAVFLFPNLFSSAVQTRSFLIASDSSYGSDVLRSFVTDFRASYPTLPSEVTLFFLPAFEKNISALLSAPPIDRGQLYQLYYPDSRIRTLFAHRGDPLPTDFRDPLKILQYLDGHFHDLTAYYRHSRRLTLFLLPTFEQQVPPLLKQEPAGGWQLYRNYVELMIADEGARLPDDYHQRQELWILQYINGHFYDVTEYYKGRRRDSSLRVIPGIETVKASINRNEYYPDYERFSTPNGGPVFFPTPGKDIFTQIGASRVTVPVLRIPPGSFLRFDVSWMYDTGDGGWAELALKTGGKETVLYREYQYPNPKGKGFRWKEMRLDLEPFAHQEGEIILKCYNDLGKNTVSDWLNWRDMVIETPAAAANRD